MAFISQPRAPPAGAAWAARVCQSKTPGWGNSRGVVAIAYPEANGPAFVPARSEAPAHLLLAHFGNEITRPALMPSEVPLASVLGTVVPSTSTSPNDRLWKLTVVSIANCGEA